MTPVDWLIFVFWCSVAAIGLCAVVVTWIDYTMWREAEARRAKEAEDAKTWHTPKPPAPKPEIFWRG